MEYASPTLRFLLPIQGPVLECEGGQRSLHKVLAMRVLLPGRMLQRAAPDRVRMRIHCDSACRSPAAST